jgi:hypothetical protein
MANIEVNRAAQPLTFDLSNRLGLRVQEFSRAYGLSVPTVWRRIQSGDINVVHVGSVPIITRTELQRLGPIAST